jgi:hypothetical protein
VKKPVEPQPQQQLDLAFHRAAGPGPITPGPIERQPPAEEDIPGGPSKEVAEEAALLVAWRRVPQPVNLLYACICTFSAKGADYSKEDADRISNFRESADECGVTIQQSWYIYAYKHWNSVKAYVKKGKLETEPLWKRLMDVIVYCTLLALIAKDQRTPGAEAPAITDYKSTEHA